MYSARFTGKVMKKKAYNTTVYQSYYDHDVGKVRFCSHDPFNTSETIKFLMDPPVSDARADDFIVDEFNADFTNAVLKYHHQTNLVRDEFYFHKRVRLSRIGLIAPTYTEHQFPRMSSLAPNCNPSDLVALDSYLNAYMQDPTAFGACPIVDMLHLTLDISDRVVAKLRTAIKSAPKKYFTVVTTGDTKQLKHNHEAYERYALFKNHLGEYITLYWGMRPEIRQKRTKHRLGKLSFNPARFTRKELKSFFHWLKGVIGSKGQKVIKTANVTRVDIALDLIGVPANALLLDQPNSSDMTIVLNRIRHSHFISREHLALGTMSIGPSNSSKTTVYDKALKLFHSGPNHIPLIWQERLLNISRIERKHNPADHRPYNLSELALKTPFFLKGTVLYRPLLLSQLDDGQLADVKKVNFTYWLRHGDGVKKLGIDLLESFLIQLNTPYMKDLQRKELRYLAKVIADA